MSRSAPVAAASREQVDVVLDADLLETACRVGALFHASVRGSSTFSFQYDENWLRRPGAFAIDPDLQLYGGETYPSGSTGVFRIFLDSAPDRWGKVLLDRREGLRARAEKRRPRALSEWDYLLGVHDGCRLGALRFRRDADSPFLDDDSGQAAPPLASLRDLEAASLALEDPDASERPQFQQWLQALLAPGSSLGGSRPKANFTDPDHGLWIAKFPSRQDRYDMGAWEMVVHLLAQEAGLRMADARLLSLHGPHHIFACRRFDRTVDGRRRFFVSAMTLLQKKDGESASYLDLAEFISTQGSAAHRNSDLEQLWTRVIFNILVSNTDDHLRNHGFILEPDGWRLSPAYDLNPSVAGSMHQLAIDESDPSPDLAVAQSTMAHYGLSQRKASALLKKVTKVVASWRAKARALGLRQDAIRQMEPAFMTSG